MSGSHTRYIQSYKTSRYTITFLRLILPEFDVNDDNVWEERSRLNDAFVFLDEENVEVKILTIRGYDESSSGNDIAKVRADKAFYHLRDIAGYRQNLTLDDPVLIWSSPGYRPNKDNLECINEDCSLKNSVEISYSVLITPLNSPFIPKNSPFVERESDMWQLSLNQNINYTHNLKKTEKGIVAECGTGIFSQLSSDDPDSESKKISRKFMYITGGVGLGVNGKPPKMGDTIWQHVMDRLSNIGVGLESNPFEIDGMRFDGGFPTFKPCKIKNVYNIAVLALCQVGGNFSAGFSGGISGSLVAMAIPIKGSNGSDYVELTGTILAGYTSGFSPQLKIDASLQLSLTAGFMYFG